MTHNELIKINVDNVSKTYFDANGKAVPAVKWADFFVRQGEFLVILGPSGCGKSTLLRIIAGLERASSGKVFIDGIQVDSSGRDRGMVFQSYTSFPWLTVARNIAFGLKLKNSQRSDVSALVDHYLDATGLTDFANTYPKDLSGGMQQRVAIARTMANDPEILLMDEPFGALDAQTRWEMQELLQRVWIESGNTVIFVTHDVEEAIYLGDRIYVSTARPSELCRDFDVTFARPRESSLKSSGEFAALEREITDLIRTENYQK